MKYFIKSVKDTTLYSDYKSQNAGIDAILNLFKIKTDILHLNSRLLIDFDISTVSASIANGDITNPKFYLELKTTNIHEISSNFDLVVHAVSQSWDNGLGKRQDTPKTTTGVSWTYRDYLGGLAWSNEGGDFVSAESASFSFTETTSDVNIDVTDIVTDWISGSYTNNGFIVKFTDIAESDNKNYGEINFFSSETNTIYSPKLSVQWDDSQQTTGSISEVRADSIYCTITNLRKEYKTNNTYRFRISARDSYAINAPVFSDSTPYSVINRLPTTSYYSIVDNVTDDVIVPFSDYSKISCDENGSYFLQNFNGWESERFYKILIKVMDSDGVVEYVDRKFTFNLIE